MIKSHYLPYSRQDLIAQIQDLEVSQVGSQILTKYQGRLLKTANVSSRYEIFDIKQYLLDKLDQIEANFTITSYCLVIKGGLQSLVLLSDTISIGGQSYQKGFFLLNSTDKSRALNFNVGLYNSTQNWYYLWDLCHVKMYQKHLRGITYQTEQITDAWQQETFQEQISSLEDLVGQSVLYSELVKVIVPDPTVKVNLAKLASFNQRFLSLVSDSLTVEQIQYLSKSPEQLLTSDLHFYIDAFVVLRVYLSIFARADSYLMKRETTRISQITQMSLRNNILESLGV